MSYSLPVALKLEGRACLVVGNGSEALRRVEALVEAGARVTLVSLSPTHDLLTQIRTFDIDWAAREFADGDLDGMWLAILCERDHALAERMGRAAEVRQVFFCAIDQPAHNSFAHVGLARSGSLFLAVGTEGKAPALARRLKHELSRLLASKALRDFVESLILLRERTPPHERAELLAREARRLRLAGDFVIDPSEDPPPR